MNPPMKQQPPQALLMQAVALHQQGQLDQAKALYEQVLEKQPKNFDALHLSGVIALQNQDFALAAERIEKAIALNSKQAAAYSNLGNALQALKRWDEALVSYDKAIALEPNSGSAHYNRGKLLRKLNRFDEALQSYEKSIAIKPDDSEAWNNRGIVMHQLGRLDEALVNYQRAIEIQPEYADAYNNRVLVLQELYQWAEALADCERILAIRPNYELLLGMMGYLRSQICDWQSYVQDRQHLQDQLSRGTLASSPFPLLGLFDDPVLQKSAAEIWVQAHHSGPSPLGPITTANALSLPCAHTSPHLGSRKIRLGYYSTDFHNQATAYLMAQLFECHDKNRFELYAFSFGPDIQDRMRQRLVAAFDHFIDVRFETDQAVAQRSRDLGIDIAVDLKGYTQDSRSDIFACRCAPVQVNYLGYPGTMGAPFMDYLIADKVVIPPESQEHYSEQVVYLPHSYQVNDGHREIASTVWRKADLGLPEEGFVFCCFNNSYKITPSTFASWMRILQAVPGSVLWLLGDNDTAQRNLRRYAQAAGVDPSRLVFGLRVPTPEHLARHRAADLFLDTLPCNAHTTASDALWAGLPVLTQQGQAFAGRVAASLLHAVGLPELIVHTAQQYEDMAIALARDPLRLNQIKQKLAAQRDTAPLFNTKQLARDIEQVYAAMHERAQAGLAAQGFEVVKS